MSRFNADFSASSYPSFLTQAARPALRSAGVAGASLKASSGCCLTKAAAASKAAETLCPPAAKGPWSWLASSSEADWPASRRCFMFKPCTTSSLDLCRIEGSTWLSSLDITSKALEPACSQAPLMAASWETVSPPRIAVARGTLSSSKGVLGGSIFELPASEVGLILTSCIHIHIYIHTCMHPDTYTHMATHAYTTSFSTYT